MQDNFSIYTLAKQLANRFSIPNARNLSRGIGYISYRLVAKQKEIIQNNLNLVLCEQISSPEINQLSCNLFRNFMETIYEFLMLPRYGYYWFENNVENPKSIQQPIKMIKSGKSILNLGGHIGNWEFLAAYGVYRGLKTMVISAPHLRRPDTIFFKKQRKRLGIADIDVHQSSRKIVESIKTPGTLTAILCDRLYQGPVSEINIFGRTKKISVGGFKLAVKYRLPVFFTIAVKMPSGKYRIYIDGPFKTSKNESESEGLTRMLEIYSNLYEKYVRKFPDQWYYFSPF
ncbi:MAG: hypothetical protein APR63_01285 [Desulfuromonas sp. SDB]|nr:MAG: hypothetical protein APR63_01285 [Desulfuromonas sp. SDB]